MTLSPLTQRAIPILYVSMKIIGIIIATVWFALDRHSYAPSIPFR